MHCKCADRWQDLVKVVPLNTSNRIDIIHKFAIDLMNDIDVTPFQIDLPIKENVIWRTSLRYAKKI